MNIYTALQQEKNPIILDVRENSEFKEGHIPDALHIPLNTLEYRAEEEILDFDQPIYVYCHSGVRSKVACHILSALGYTKVYNLGGIIDWPGEIVK